MWLDDERLSGISPSPFTLNIGVGQHTLRAELWEYNEIGQLIKTAQTSITFTVRKIYRVIAKNSFNGGYLIVNGQTVSSPANLDGPLNTQHTVERIDRQFHDNYIRVFDGWSGQAGGSNPTVTLYLQNDGILTAEFVKELNITVQNNFAGTGNGGTIKINDNNVSSPHTLQI
jgi:hypothetical protein